MNVEIRCNVKVIVSLEIYFHKNVVYCFLFPSGKRYIGLTTQTLCNRIGMHCSNAFNKNKSTFYGKIACAIRKYMTFEVSILYEGDALEDNEIKYISEYDTFNSGYNLTSGGETNKNVSAETSIKISTANKGRSVVNKGVSMSNEQKRLVSMACKQTYINGRINPRRKIVYQLDLEGNTLSKFDSLADAQEHTGVGFRQISRCALGQRESTGGYKWRYDI